MTRFNSPVLALSCLAALACGESAVEPGAAGPEPAALLAAAEDGCPADPDFVVVDEATLEGALLRAQPGDVIALHGMIAVSNDGILVRTADLTFTCATPGSGLRAATSLNEPLLFVFARSVTVERLVLDGRETNAAFAISAARADLDPPTLTDDVRFVNNEVLCGRRVCASFGVTPGAVVVGNRFQTGPVRHSDTVFAIRADGLRVEHNTLECGDRTCLFLVGSPGAAVADNRLESVGSSSGIHVQGAGRRDVDGRPEFPTDGTRVERNTVAILAPQTGGFGGIRVRDGIGVAIADNVVTGPWSASLNLAELADGEIEGNVAEGPRRYGIVAAGGALTPVSIRGTTFQGNRVSGAGLGGALLFRACANTFAGNDLRRNGDDVSAVFLWETGANLFAGDGGTVVDNGSFDCDGDGRTDRNLITGPGLVVRDAGYADGTTGEVASEEDGSPKPY